MAFDPKATLKQLPHLPGVYRMLDAGGQVIYVGKAKNLKNRVSSYFRDQKGSTKTSLMVSKIANIEITVTNTDNEALLLENNLIKHYRPRYNVLMKDDKSYPYIILSKHADYPRIASYRGAKLSKQRHFGPFPDGRAVKDTVHLLQKLFKLRACTDTYFKHRSRPCLQYQINRCSAPCVGHISPEDYQQAVDKAALFLSGKNAELIAQLKQQMLSSAERKQYEQAALYRDQINKLEHIQQQQQVMREKGHFDVVAIDSRFNEVGITCLNVSEGNLIGNKTTFVKQKGSSLPEVMSAFLSQTYLTADSIPPLLLVNRMPEDSGWLIEAFSELADYKVAILQPTRGDKRRWLALADKNLQQAMGAQLEKTLTYKKRMNALRQALQLPEPIGLMECFDISHNQGSETVASCVVFNNEGADKKAYRRYNVQDITPGDDYAAIEQAVTRRYTRLCREDKPLPDVVIIDGGKGQIKKVYQALKMLGWLPTRLISISKGPGRKAEYDNIWQMVDGDVQSLLMEPLAMHVIQQIRDEAHRFAITGHKAKRSKKQRHSVLEDIQGIGAKRRKALLDKFKGLQGLQQASIEDIQTVPGISKMLAETIYQYVH